MARMWKLKLRPKENFMKVEDHSGPYPTGYLLALLSTGDLGKRAGEIGSKMSGDIGRLPSLHRGQKNERGNFADFK